MEKMHNKCNDMIGSSINFMKNVNMPPRGNFCLSFSFALPVQFQEFLDFKNRKFIR